ncbi:MAG: NAD(P)-binding domain-containing protein [Candidatus Peribacteria bacterium]|jgi:glycerol-3-phosphate dehydrogenase (NAD(P)+)|nr:NAD(P)-binding domain-containing protein [Candidatus Peribacteria bacterium]
MSAISIIGAGSRGTALAQVLADNAHQPVLWSCDEKEVHLINSCHINPAYLKECVLPESIIATTDLPEALQGAEYLIIAVPSKAFSLVLEKVKPYYSGQQVIIATKGLSPSRELFFSQQAQRVLQTDKVALISGPSHAEEVIQRMPTWVSLVSPDLPTASKL